MDGNAPLDNRDLQLLSDLERYKENLDGKYLKEVIKLQNQIDIYKFSKDYYLNVSIPPVIVETNKVIVNEEFINLRYQILISLIISIIISISHVIFSNETIGRKKIELE